jgi:FkbM family methyltransferase
LKKSASRYYWKSLFTLLKGIRHPGKLIPLWLKRSAKSATRIELKTGESFLVFSLMDVWVLKETILDRQYEQIGVPLQDGWTVVDIGAALGDYSVWAAKQTPHGRLIAVEPFPPSVSLLRSNLEKNRVYNAEVFSGAIAAENGTTRLKVVGKIVQNSTASGQDGDELLEVKTVNLEELFKMYSISKCDYLKLDCEGGEYAILFNASPATFERIDRMGMEIHDGMTNHNRQEMIQFLESRGYFTRLTLNPVHQELAYLYAEKLVTKKEHL